MDLQPKHLENELVRLLPLKAGDFNPLFAIASDPLIWEQHPNKNRYQKEIFEAFFQAAIESRSAFVVADKETGNIIGSSRYYDFDEENSVIAIGFTFLHRKYWGSSYNKKLKYLMIDYAFSFVDTIIFHVGDCNIRSQKAVEKLGASKFDEEERIFSGQKILNFVYKISKTDWYKNTI